MFYSIQQKHFSVKQFLHLHLHNVRWIGVGHFWPHHHNLSYISDYVGILKTTGWFFFNRSRPSTTSFLNQTCSCQDLPQGKTVQSCIQSYLCSVSDITFAKQSRRLKQDSFNTAALAQTTKYKIQQFIITVKLPLFQSRRGSHPRQGS